MALRRPDLAEEGGWVLVRDVVARARGEEPGLAHEPEAEALARGMRGVRWDGDCWGRPMIRWAAGRELRDSLVADQRRAVERHAQAALEPPMMLPFGCVQLERPGQPTWTSPALVGRRESDAYGRVEVPG